MERNKMTFVPQSSGNVSESDSKKQSILKHTKRMPLQPLFVNASEDSDATATATMSISHQRKVSFSVGTQIKEFRNGEGISEGWGSSYEESLKTDSTRSSESSSSSSEHYGSSVLFPQVNIAVQLKPSLLNKTGSVAVGVSAIVEGPTRAVANRQQISFQQTETSECNIRNTVLHVDATVESATSQVAHVGGTRKHLVPDRSNTYNLRSLKHPDLLQKHENILSSGSSHVIKFTKECLSSADQQESGLFAQQPLEIPDASGESCLPSEFGFTKTDKQRSYPLSPAAKYSRRVLDLLGNTKMCDEQTSFEKSTDDVMKETGRESLNLPQNLSHYSLLGEPCRSKNLFKSEHEDSETDIFFPVLCNTQEVKLGALEQFHGDVVERSNINAVEEQNQTEYGGNLSHTECIDLQQPNQDWKNLQSKAAVAHTNRNLNCSEENISMELTDVLLPPPQVQVHTARTDCVELTGIGAAPPPQVQVHCPQNTSTDCMELTEPIGQVVRGTKEVVILPDERGVWSAAHGSRGSNDGDVKQCDTNVVVSNSSLSMELTDIIGSVHTNGRTESVHDPHNVSSPKESQMVKNESFLIQVPNDVEKVSSLPLSEELCDTGINSSGSVVNLSEVADSSAALNDLFLEENEISLARTGCGVGMKHSDLLNVDSDCAYKPRSLDFGHAYKSSEDCSTRGFSDNRGSFKRKTEDISSELHRKKFLAATQTDVHPLLTQIPTAEPSSCCGDDGSKSEISSLQLKSVDISNLSHLHASQNDTNFEDNTSKLLSACVDTLGRSVESALVCSASAPMGSSPAGVEVNLEDVAETVNDKVSAAVATNTFQGRDLDSVCVVGGGASERCNPLGCYTDDTKFQILRETQTCSSSEGAIETHESRSSVKVCSENLSSDKEVGSRDTDLVRRFENQTFPVEDNGDSLDSGKKEQTPNTSLECRNLIGAKQELKCTDVNCDTASETYQSYASMAATSEICGDVCNKVLSAEEVANVVDKNLSKSLTDSQPTLNPAPQEKEGNLCTPLDVNKLRGTKQELKCISDVSLMVPKCDTHSGKIDERTLVGGEANDQSFGKPSGELQDGRLTCTGVIASAVETVSSCNNENKSSVGNEDFRTTAIISVERSNTNISKDVKNTEELLVTNKMCETFVENLEDGEKQPQNPDHSSGAETASVTEGELQSSNNFLGSPEIVTDNVGSEKIVPVNVAKVARRYCDISPRCQKGETLQFRNQTQEMSLSKESAQQSEIEVSKNLPSIEDNITGPVMDSLAVPLEVKESISNIDNSIVSVGVGSDAMDVDEENLSFCAVVEVDSARISPQEQNGNGMDYSHTSERLHNSPNSNTREVNDDNMNLSICDSSLMEDFSIGCSPDQQNLMKSPRSSPRCIGESELVDCVLISTAANEEDSFLQLSRHARANQCADVAEKCDLCQSDANEKQHDRTANDTSSDRNNPGSTKTDAAVDGRGSPDFVTKVSAVDIVECDRAFSSPSGAAPVSERQSETLTSVDKMPCDVGDSPVISKKFGETSMPLSEASSSGAFSTSSASDSRRMSSREHNGAPGPVQSVEDFINEFSKREECLWTIKTMGDEEWIFQFLFTSLELVLKFSTEALEKPPKYRTITDVYLNSRITERTDPLAHLVHHIILKQFTVDALKSFCSTIEDVPGVLHRLSTEVFNMSLFMLEFDMYEKTGRLVLKGKCVTMNISYFKLGLLFEVTVDLTNWGNISENDVSTRAIIGSVREEDIQRLVCTVAQGRNFLGQYILAIDDYLQHLTSLSKEIY